MSLGTANHKKWNSFKLCQKHYLNIFQLNWILEWNLDDGIQLHFLHHLWSHIWLALKTWWADMRLMPGWWIYPKESDSYFTANAKLYNWTDSCKSSWYLKYIFSVPFVLSKGYNLHLEICKKKTNFLWIKFKYIFCKCCVHLTNTPFSYRENWYVDKEKLMKVKRHV